MDYFTSPKKLKLNKLPTKLDILRAFIYETEKWLDDNETKKKPSHSMIADILTEKIQRVYHVAGVKTVRKDKIKERVKKIYNSRLDLLKISRTKRHTEMFTKKNVEYSSYMSDLFDVADDVSRVTAQVSEKPRLKVDATISNIQLTDKRSAAILSRQKSYALITDDTTGESAEIVETENDSFSAVQKRPATIIPTDLSEIIEAKSRSASDRATSAIVNATLRVFNIPIIIDKSRLRRAEERTFNEVSKHPVVFGGGLFYDSRKDRSIIRQKKRDESGKFKFYRTMGREEHYSLVSEPDGLFLGFVSVKKGNAEHGGEAITTFLKKKKIFNDLDALGCDGTNVNVGSKGGINHYIESKLQRPLHWFICLLHGNEIPLKTLIIKLDGPTTGVRSFSGPIGKMLGSVCRSRILNFKKFDDVEPLPEFPIDVYKKLSSDQKYLYKIVNALITGHFPQSLAQLNIGPLNHSRWVTTASRVCRLFASTSKPSENLKIITSYIVKVYAPTWFQIKKNELAINGPQNLFFLIKKSNLVRNKKAKSIVQKRIQRNAFFAHSENMLLAQLASRNKSLRTEAVNKILNIRNRVPNGEVRRFKVPEINFRANTWTDIAISSESDMTEPPFTRNMCEEELLNVIHQPLKIPKFRCHTQMVERAVKEVSRVSKKLIDPDRRNMMIKTTLMNRAKYPKLNSKKDFLVTHDKSVSFLSKI